MQAGPDHPHLKAREWDYSMEEGRFTQPWPAPRRAKGTPPPPFSCRSGARTHMGMGWWGPLAQVFMTVE